MIGSFHESMISSRHFSSSFFDGNTRHSIDENSSNDDLLKVQNIPWKSKLDLLFFCLFKEILTLRKEREQDKQTIKLLQEQMVRLRKTSLPFTFFFLCSINIPVKQMIKIISIPIVNRFSLLLHCHT